MQRLRAKVKLERTQSQCVKGTKGANAVFAPFVPLPLPLRLMTHLVNLHYLIFQSYYGKNFHVPKNS